MTHSVFVFNHIFWLRSLLFCLCLKFSFFAEAQENKHFIRFISDGLDRRGELQTAIVSYTNISGTKIDLVSAVHLGDREYYDWLNKYFEGKDIVLYELVANADDRPLLNAERTGTSPISFLQKALGSFLGLSFQLEQIDYATQNFIHADLNPDQLRKAMEDKDQNLFSTFFALAAAQSISLEDETATTDTYSSFDILSLLDALTSGDHRNSLKYLFAEELGKGGNLQLTPEIENQIPILGDRNEAVIAKLIGVISDPNIKNIAIFYGAAHMPGLERVILGELGFQRSSERWLSAWEIP